MTEHSEGNEPTQPVGEPGPPSPPPAAPTGPSDPPSGPPSGPPTEPVPLAPPSGAFGPLPTSPVPPVEPGAPPGVPLPPYVESPPKRRRGRLVAGAIGVVAVVGAAAFAVTSLTSGDDEGASSPEAAVRGLLDAAASEDIIGVLEALPPGERSALKGPIEDVTDELKRLEILSEDFDLGNVPGFDLEFEGVELEADEIGPGVSMVEVTAGSVTGRTSADEIPVGETLESLIVENGGSVDVESSETTESIAGTRVVTIQEEGGWHVSLFYSLAELGRESAELPVPDFGNGVEPDGADSPEGAVEALVSRSVDLDVRGLIALLPPDEMRVLHDYAPLFLEEAEAAAAEARGTFDISVEDLGLDVEGSGDTRKVKIRSFAMTGTADGQEFEASFDGECFRGTSDGQEEEVCLGDDLGEEFGVFEGMVTDAFTDAGVIVLERDGAWYVSPTQTLFGFITSFLKSVDREDIDRFQDFLDSIFAVEGFEEVGDVIPGDDTGIIGDPGDEPEDSTTTTTSSEDSTTTTPTTTGGGSSGDLLPPVAPDEFEFDGEGLDPGSAEFYALAQDCYDGGDGPGGQPGDMQACDDLYTESDFGSAFEAYGSSCAGRIPDNPDFCVAAIGPTAPN